MELQKIFTSVAFDEFKSQIKQGIGLEKYRTGEFNFDNDSSCSLMGIYKPNGLAKSLSVSKTDFENAKLLYEAYEGLTPLIASSERFWAYLAHIEYFQYCQNRWPDVLNVPFEIPTGYNFQNKKHLNEETLKINEYISYILTHWFFYAGGRFRNALAGLWWPIYMTVDEKRKDKYELSEVLFSQADVRATAYASTLFRHKPAIQAILEFYLENDIIRDKGWQWRNRYIFHYFNRIGGVTNLFYLDKKYFKDELNKNKNLIKQIMTSDDVSNRDVIEWI